MDTGETMRADRGIRAGLRQLDEEPRWRQGIDFCPEWHAQALADYIAECRARPDVQVPDFDEYARDWLDARLHDEAAQADAEAVEERRVEAAMMKPLASPCGDDDSDYPF
jgi:O-glycosyl hydrolase